MKSIPPHQPWQLSSWVVIVVAAFTLKAGAGDILINNASFEDPPLEDGFLTSSTIPDWIGGGSTFHVINSVDAYFSNTSEGSTGPNPLDGVNAAALNTSAKIEQDLGVALEGNTVYTLTYLAGHRLRIPFGQPTVRLMAGETVLTASTPNPTEDSFVEMADVYYSPPSGPAVGQTLRLEVQGSGTGAQAWFDHFRLSAQELPSEPTFQTQPQSQSVALGGVLSLDITVFGATPLTYQWQFNGSDITGQTGPMLLLTDLEYSDAGDYTVVVANAFGSATSEAAAIVVADPPSIVTPPVSQSVSQGDPVTFSVVAAGSPPLTYQWLRDDLEIPGATADTFTIASTGISDQGTYTVRVENEVGTVLSEAAQLEFVLAPDQIFIANHSFEDPLLEDGDLTRSSMPGWTGTESTFHVINSIDAYFSNTSEGSSGPSPLDGRNAAALNTTAIIQQDLGVTVEANTEYTLAYLAGRRIGILFGQPTVRLLAGTVALAESQPDPTEDTFVEGTTVYQSPASGSPLGQNLRIEVQGSGNSAQAWFDNFRLFKRELPPEPSLQTHPQSQSIALGATLSLEVKANGALPLTYQWQFNGVDLEGQTGENLVLIDVRFSDAGDYTVVVANAFGSVTSEPATIVVAEPPTIVTPPLSQSVIQGDPVTFSVTAAGSEPLTYQWLHNDQEIAGATAASLTLPITEFRDQGAYAVRVENTVGSILSEAVQLSFVTPPGQILVANYSFEDPSLNDGTLRSDTLPGWMHQRDSFHIINPVDSYFSNTSDDSTGPYPIDGWNAIALNSEAEISQTLDETLQPNTQYTLKVLAGHRKRVAFGSPLVSLFAGNSLLAQSAPNPPEDTFVETSLSYAAFADNPLLGQPLRIQINGVGSGVQAWFDRVRLWAGGLASEPAILLQPASIEVGLGEDVVFTIEATGAPPLSYQWQFNGVDIAGGTDRILTLADVQLENEGDYAVVVSNEHGTVTSEAAQLAVLPTPTILLAIENASFETPELDDGKLTVNEIPGWTGENSTFHVVNPVNSFFSGASDGVPGSNPIDGRNACAINDGGTVYQELSETLRPHTTYELTFLAGNRRGVALGDPTVRLLAGGELLAESRPSPPEDSFIEETIAYRSPFSGDLIGQPLRVEIRSTGRGAQAWLDHFRLTSQALFPGPLISEQPESALVALGATISLEVVVEGAPPFSFQWQFNGLDLAGQTRATLTLNQLQFSDGGEYTVVVSNEFGSTTSDPALLTVLQPPSLVLAPSQQTASLGETVTFEAEPAGTEPLVYQWLREDLPIAGATNSVLVLSDVSIDDSGTYRIRIENPVGSILSEPVHLTLIGGSGRLVIPPDLAQEEGPASSDTLVGASRIQQVYESRLFPPSPVLIEQIQWRPDGPTGTAFTNGPVEVMLRMSSTSVQADKLSLVFQENAGPDEFVAYDGPVTLSSSRNGPGEGPVDFDITVSLPTPFLYDPGAGNLLVDLLMPRALQASSSDAVAGINTGVSRLMASDPAASQADSLEFQADVLQLAYRLEPTPPVVIQSPEDLPGAWGGEVFFFVRATGSRPLNYQWLFNGAPMAGQTGPSLRLTSLVPADAGTYSVMLENPFGSATSGAATLTLLVPPFILEQPRPLTVTEGGSAVLSVVTSGDEPLSHQWFRDGAPLMDARESSLVLDATQLGDAGEYTVSVSNPVATEISNPANLRVLPRVGRAVVVGDASGTQGQTIVVPVRLMAQGDENALGFSIVFATNELAFTGAGPGSDAQAASLNVNQSQAAEGRLGIALALPAGTKFSPGSQELLLLSFGINATTSPLTSMVDFDDSPVLREISDEQAGALASAYFQGRIYVEEPAGLEGDVMPLLSGNNLISITDWVQVGRYAAQLATVPNLAQFQRADCAPRSSLGNGAITVSDWVQAGRYAAGLDPWTTAGGPAGPIMELSQGGGSSLPSTHRSLARKRRLQMIPSPSRAGHGATVLVVLDSLGNENALGFSIEFEATKFRVESVSLGRNAADATLNVNSQRSARGQLGVALSLPSGQNFSPGSHELLELTLAPRTKPIGVTSLTFSSQPVTLEVSDPLANVLESEFPSAILELPPNLSIARNNDSIILSWPVSTEDYHLESTSQLVDGADWRLLDPERVISEGAIRVQLPLKGKGQYFRIRK